MLKILTQRIFIFRATIRTSSCIWANDLKKANWTFKKMSLELWARATLTDKNTQIFECLLCNSIFSEAMPCQKKRTYENTVDQQNWKGLKLIFKDFRHSSLLQTIHKWRRNPTLATPQRCVERFEGHITGKHLCWDASKKMQHVKRKTNREASMAGDHQGSYDLHAWSLLKTTLTVQSSIRFNYLEKNMQNYMCCKKKCTVYHPHCQQPHFLLKEISWCRMNAKSHEPPRAWHTFFAVKAQLNHF